MSDDSSIDVRITADSSAVPAGMGKAGDAVTAGLDKIKAAFASMGNPFQKIVSKEAAAEAKESLESLTSPIERLKTGFAALAVVMAGGELGEVAKKAAEFGESIERASQKTGIGTTAMQELRFAAGMADVGFDQLQLGLAQLSRKMAEGGDATSATGQAFRAVGISGSALKNMRLEDVMAKIADKFRESEDGAGKSAIAMALFGRAGAEMIPFLNKGSEGIDELRQKAEELGIVFGGETIKSLTEYNEQLKTVHAVHEAMSTQVGVALVPSLLQISKAFQGGLQEGGPFKTFLDGLGEVIKVLTSLASHLAQGFQELGTIIGATIAQVVSFLTLPIRSAGTAFADIQGQAAQDLQQLAQRYEKFRADLESPVKVGGDGGIDFGSDGDGQFGKKKELKFSVQKPPKKEAEPQSRVGQWDAQLASAKVYYQTEHGLREMSKAEEVEYWQNITETQSLTEQERIAIEKRIANAQLEALKKAAAERKAITAEQINEAEATANSAVAMEEEMADRRVQLGLTTVQQMLAEERNFENEKFQIQVTAQQARIAATANDPNAMPSALQKVKDELLAIERAHALNVEKINTKVIADSTAGYRQMFTSIQQSFQGILTNLLTGAITVRNAMKQAFTSVVSAAGQMLSEYLVKKASAWATETSLYQSFLAGKNASEAASAVSTGATKAAEADAVVTANAAEGASGAAASVASIPYVGPVLAIAAFAAIMALILGAKGGGKSAAGGYDIPSGTNPMTQLHSEEMVLPAKHANVIRGMADNGGGSGGSGGDVHLHVHAIDGQSVKKLFRDNGQHIVSAINAQRRNFNPGAA